MKGGPKAKAPWKGAGGVRKPGFMDDLLSIKLTTPKLKGSSDAVASVAADASRQASRMPSPPRPEGHGARAMKQTDGKENKASANNVARKPAPSGQSRLHAVKQAAISSPKVSDRCQGASPSRLPTAAAPQRSQGGVPSAAPTAKLSKATAAETRQRPQRSGRRKVEAPPQGEEEADGEAHCSSEPEAGADAEAGRPRRQRAARRFGEWAGEDDLEQLLGEEVDVEEGDGQGWASDEEGQLAGDDLAASGAEAGGSGIDDDGGDDAEAAVFRPDKTAAARVDAITHEINSQITSILAAAEEEEAAADGGRGRRPQAKLRDALGGKSYYERLIEQAGGSEQEEEEEQRQAPELPPGALRPGRGSRADTRKAGGNGCVASAAAAVGGRAPSGARQAAGGKGRGASAKGRGAAANAQRRRGVAAAPLPPARDVAAAVRGAEQQQQQRAHDLSSPSPEKYLQQKQAWGEVVEAPGLLPESPEILGARETPAAALVRDAEWAMSMDTQGNLWQSFSNPLVGPGGVDGEEAGAGILVGGVAYLSGGREEVEVEDAGQGARQQAPEEVSDVQQLQATVSSLHKELLQERVQSVSAKQQLEEARRQRDQAREEAADLKRQLAATKEELVAGQRERSGTQRDAVKRLRTVSTDLGSASKWAEEVSNMAQSLVQQLQKAKNSASDVSALFA